METAITRSSGSALLPRRLRPLVATRFAVTRIVRVGDAVVDATVGNGHDTELLARLVGPSGAVLGFDIQPAAISATSRRLATAGLADRAALHLGSHHDVGLDQIDSIRACMFNLGYLPGGDKSIVTRAATTIPALEQACFRLATGGIVSIVVYPAHAGGGEEAREVDAFCNELRASRYRVEQVRVAERPGAAYAYHIFRLPSNQSRTNDLD